MGTEFKLCIGGSWKSHGKFIKSYLQKVRVCFLVEEAVVLDIDTYNMDGTSHCYIILTRRSLSLRSSQLAVITPYASFSFDFVPGTGSKITKVSLSYPRTSDNMPPLSKHVKHHPSSVNNLLIQQLLV